MPLFVEELTKAVLESAAQGDRVAAVLGTASLAALSVPVTTALVVPHVSPLVP